MAGLWTEHLDPAGSGRAYYFNMKGMRSTWERPPELGPDPRLPATSTSAAAFSTDSAAQGSTAASSSVPAADAVALSASDSTGPTDVATAATAGVGRGHAGAALQHPASGKPRRGVKMQFALKKRGPLARGHAQHAAAPSPPQSTPAVGSGAAAAVHVASSSGAGAPQPPAQPRPPASGMVVVQSRTRGRDRAASGVDQGPAKRARADSTGGAAHGAAGADPGSALQSSYLAEVSRLGQADEGSDSIGGKWLVR